MELIIRKITIWFCKIQQIVLCVIPCVMKKSSIGHGLASILDKESKHAIKQIDRYLSNEAIEEEFFECWVKYQVGSLTEIVLAMDWTEFGRDEQTMLTIHQISRHSRAMPLL